MTDDGIPVLDCFGNAFSVGDGISPPVRTEAAKQQGPMIPCQIDGSPVAATLRGFGHGWQGQHWSTNSVAVEITDSQPLGFLTSAGTFSVDPVVDGSPTVRTTGCVGVVEIITEETHMTDHTTLAVRRLTPRECERLMGWPDDWTRYGDDGRELGDTHRYRMCGNGVVSDVAEWIGRRLPDVAGGTDD